MRYGGLTIVTLAGAAAIAPIPATLVERWYSQTAYAALEPVVSAVSGVLPFALLDVGGAVGLICVVWTVARWWRQLPFLSWVYRVLAATLVAAAVLYLWFLSFWGLNYRRVPLEEKLAYDPTRVSRDQALRIGRIAVEQVNALAPQARGAADEDGALRAALDDVERLLGARRMSRKTPPKLSLVTTYFRTAAIDGMTNPFFLEIIISSDLLPFERPHTLAHEWAHLAGYADESEANFVAWLACVRSTPRSRYSGWLSAYEHVSRVLPREDRKSLQSALSPLVVADIQAIRARLARASPAVSTAARSAYDTYLRANRINEGIENYGAVVRLMLGTAFQPDWTPELRVPRP